MQKQYTSKGKLNKRKVLEHIKRKTLAVADTIETIPHLASIVSSVRQSETSSARWEEHPEAIMQSSSSVYNTAVRFRVAWNWQGVEHELRFLPNRLRV